MRKTIFAFLFAIMFSMAIGSCGNGTATPTDVDSVAVDTTVVDSMVTIDSIAVDTIAVDTIVAE